MQVSVKQMNQTRTCGCGRSPTGQCIGWHGLSEQEYQKRLAEHNEKMLDKPVADK